MLIPKFLFNQIVIFTTLYLFGFRLSEFLDLPIEYRQYLLIVILPGCEWGMLSIIMDWRFMDDCGFPTRRMSTWRRVLGDWNARVIVYLMVLFLLVFSFVMFSWMNKVEREKSFSSASEVNLRLI